MPLNAEPSYLDGDWTGSKDGYVFTLATTGDEFTCIAIPAVLGTTGVRQFFVDQTTVIRHTSDNIAVNASSKPIDR